MGQTKDFFKEKKAWSLFKDKILDYYLSPYIPKILRTGKPLVIFDCFAGKGKFADGNNGSPIIIAEHIKSTLQKYPSMSHKIKSFFIEKKYNKDLKENLKDYPNTKVLEGTFEDNLKNILGIDKNSNVFLYVDPYGIKSLNLDNFYQIKNSNFSSIEILMNFNSAGFLREGCRLLKFDSPFKDDEISDYESDEDVNTIERMNAIAGGNYWQDILLSYYENKMDIHQAEEQFISEYSSRIKNIFRYSVNIPIKLRFHHLPKYRLIFGTNHEDGLILMADNMHKKWKEIVAGERGSQQVLFDFEFPDLALLKGFDLQSDVLSYTSTIQAGIPLKTLIVKLILEYGITLSESALKKKIRQMEQDKALLIDRFPSHTKTNKPATSMDYDQYRITVRKPS